MKSNIIKSFTNKFNLSYSQLSPSDVDFKIMDSKGKIVSYAQVEMVDSFSFGLTIKAERAVRLYNKRLNGIILFSDSKKTYYARIENLSGEISSDKLDYGFDELVITYKDLNQFQIFS
jgi:hypothetical protein